VRAGTARTGTASATATRVSQRRDIWVVLRF
jgi:hypothetical protein